MPREKNSSSKARFEFNDSCLNRKIISLEPLFALKNTKPHRRTDLPYICSLQTLFSKNEKKNILAIITIKIILNSV